MLIKRIMDECIDLVGKLAILGFSAKAIQWIVIHYGNNMPDFIMVIIGIIMLLAPIATQSLLGTWSEYRKNIYGTYCH